MRDYRESIIAIILVICLVIMMMTILAGADDALRISAKAFALYEPTTETFLYHKNLDQRLPMASTTKIMTAILAIETLDADEYVEVPSDIENIEGTSLYLKAGDLITVENLVYSLLLQSANDAAELLAYKIAGDINAFAYMMNEKAAALGLSNTHYVNPHGLDDDGHYTTARDLAALASYCLQNSTFSNIVSTYKHTFCIGEKERVLINHNKLLKRYEGCIGVKTGYTKKSGRCLVSAAEKEDVKLICVTLDAPDDWKDHTALFDAGFGRFRALNLKSAIPTHLPVISGDKERIAIKIADECDIVLGDVSDKFDYEVRLKQYLVAPIAKNETVGTITIYKNNKEYKTIDIIADEDVKSKRFNIFDYLGGIKKPWKKLEYRN